jgi:serine/threonine protein kinase/tetratricopeptide (TPR) repeat protein
MSPPPTDRLHRLNRAVDAYLAFQARGGAEGVPAFLADNADLADLLAPMMSGEADEGSTEGEGNGPEDAEDWNAGPQPGRVFGDYRILREVGRGGMGVVFEAEQISLTRRVALKLLHGHLALSARAIGRFRAEAAAAARLNHPGIVPIYEVGERGGHHFFTMEFVDGAPLNALIHREKLDAAHGEDNRSRAAQVASLVAQVADALQCAHDNGLVHRDVKPHNIMCSAGGAVRLLDFGLAKHVDRRASSASGFLGTPYYMSPEQALGDSSIGPRSDIFSLGVVLYELLARARPFDGETPQAVVRSIECREPTPLARLAPRTPNDLHTICYRAMEKEPDQRYPSAGAMAADLRRFLRFEPILAQPPSAWDHAAKWIRRHRRGVFVGIGIAVVALVTAIAYSVQQGKTNAVIADQTQRATDSDGLAFRGIEQLLGVLSETVGYDPERAAEDRERIAPVMALCDEYLSLAEHDLGRRRRVAVAYHAIAGIHQRLRDLTLALNAMDRAIAAMSLVAEEQPDQRPFLAAMLRRVMILEQEHTGGGATAFAEAQRLFEPLIVQSASAPADAAGDPLLAEAVEEWIHTLLSRGLFLVVEAAHRQEGERLLQIAYDLVPRLIPERRTSQEFQRALSRIRGGLAHAKGRRGEFDAALDMTSKALAALPQPPKDRASKHVQLGLLVERSQLFRLARRSEESHRELEAAVVLVDDLLAANRGDVQALRGALEIYTGLANGLIVGARPGEAEVLLRRGLALASPWRFRAAELPIDLRTSLASLVSQTANSLLAGALTPARTTEAEQLLGESAAILDGVIAERPSHYPALRDLGATWSNLASLRNQQGRWPEALQCARLATGHQRRALAVQPGAQQSATFLGLHLTQEAAALVGMEQYAAAAVAMAGALDAAPTHPICLGQAVSLSAKVLTACPDDPDAAAVGRRALQLAGEHNPTLARRLMRTPTNRPLTTHPEVMDLMERLNHR